MDFFQEVHLEAPEAEAIARGLYAIARADGMHAREAALVQAFYAEVGGTAQSLAELERRDDIPPAELAAALPTDEKRRLFVKTAILLAFADGKVTPEEEKAVNAYAKALGLPHDELVAIEDQVREFLLGHLAHLRNTEATREVAKKLGI